MILLCQNCGWRINERSCDKKPEDIGKYLIYSNKPFCSEYCIEKAKLKPYVLTRTVYPSDWNEQGLNNWKIQRKIIRKPRPMRKIQKIYSKKKSQ